MLRILLTVVLPILLPLLLYIGYVSIMRRRAELAGEESPPPWQEGPWPWLIFGGLALVAAILVTLRLTTGVPPGTKIEAPRLVDGKVVPSHVAE
jgi:hypothetical protein